MRIPFATTLIAAASAFAASAYGQVTFYEREDFSGRSFATEQRVDNLARRGFNDRASSVVVRRQSWEICEHAQFEGRCVVLQPGRYASLAAFDLNDQVSSLQMVSFTSPIADPRSAPNRAGPYDYRRRGNERLYQAEVTSVRAVLGTSEQRCWVERAQIEDGQLNANVPAAVAGAIIGGILGHQVGGGRGRDLATVGGAVAGGAVGYHLGGDSGPEYGREVQRCEQTSRGSRPDYWDVAYEFRGNQYRIQMVHPPGETITVNRRGEPRV